MKLFFYSFFLLFTGLLLGQEVDTELNTLLANKNYSEAQNRAEKIYQDNPNNLNAILVLGDLSSYQKDWDKAIIYYQKAIELQPSQAKINFKLGGAMGMKALSVSKIQAMVYIGDIKKYLERTVELDPNHVQARRALVELYMQLPGLIGGDEDRAIELSDQLMKIDIVNGFLAKAFIAKENNEPEEAKGLFKKAYLEYVRNNTGKLPNSLNYEMGKISAEQNLYPEKGLELLDNYSNKYSYIDIYAPEWVYLRKAQIYTNLENKSLANENIEKALTLKGGFKEAQKQKDKISSL